MNIDDIKYFHHQKENRNPVFLSRFPDLSFKDMKVMDLGCGLGALSIDMAERDAKEVTGVDINCSLIDFARDNLKQNYPQFQDKIYFVCDDIRNLSNDHFDIIISKASFEHILDLDTLLNEMQKKLKPGGKIYSGFGPLYRSPWGDHNRLRHKIPWAHVIPGEKHFIDKLNRKSPGRNLNNIYDLGLNGYTLKKYKEVIFNTPGLRVIDFSTNVSNKLSMKIFNLFALLPFLKEYFTYNIYCILERIK